MRLHRLHTGLMRRIHNFYLREHMSSAKPMMGFRGLCPSLVQKCHELPCKTEVISAQSKFRQSTWHVCGL